MGTRDGMVTPKAAGNRLVLLNSQLSMLVVALAGSGPRGPLLRACQLSVLIRLLPAGLLLSVS
jgi:hypothetical protein